MVALSARLAARPNCLERLGFVVSQVREIEDARQKRLEQQPETGPHAMVRLLARIVGVGVETADMLVHEVLSRPMRDRRAVARYAGLTQLRRFDPRFRDFRRASD
jgi:transposase